MSMVKLKRYIRKNGKAKTAVALGLKETNAINNWIARDEIPQKFKKDVKLIDKIQVQRLIETPVVKAEL